MKSINKIFLGLCAIGMLAFASCDKTDDSPSKPTVPGLFKGDFQSPTDGSVIEWVASSTSAVHDTSLFGNLRIIAKNAGGDQIAILLSDTAVGYYSLFQNTFNESTYESGTLSAVATTRSNDVPTQSGPSQSTIEITDNGMSDGRIKGVILVAHWYIVDEGVADDTRIGIFLDGEFDMPITRVGMRTGTITAKIDGVPFAPTDVMSTGLTLTGMNVTSGQTLGIGLPSNATIGSHDFESMFDDYNVSYSSGTSTNEMEGTVVVTAFNSAAGTITGTFEATATPSGGGESISITEGTFSY